MTDKEKERLAAELRCRKEYVKETAKLMDLNLSPKYLAGVTDNFNQIGKIAALVTEFELPENIEASPKFEP